MAKFSNAELLDCAKREVRFRRKVYRRLVAERKMTQADADRETAMMQAIVELLSTKQSPDLF
jgi:hypothetical protein